MGLGARAGEVGVWFADSSWVVGQWRKLLSKAAGDVRITRQGRWMGPQNELCIMANCAAPLGLFLRVQVLRYDHGKDYGCGTGGYKALIRINLGLRL